MYIHSGDNSNIHNMGHKMLFYFCYIIYTFYLRYFIIIFCPYYTYFHS